MCIRDRFNGADECAHELAVHLRSNRVSIDPLSGKDVTGILGAIDAGRLNIDLLESCGSQLLAIRNIFKSAGDTANPKKNAAPNLREYFTLRHDIGHGKAATGLQHAKCLAKNSVFISGEIDDAIRDDDIHGIIPVSYTHLRA